MKQQVFLRQSKTTLTQDSLKDKLRFFLLLEENYRKINCGGQSFTTGVKINDLHVVNSSIIPFTTYFPSIIE